MNPSSNASSRRVVIIGGVAGGASTAARLRRIDEFAEIIVLERGPDVSFANCGLPYFIGGEIKERSVLAVQTPDSLKALLDLDVRTHHEAFAIDRNQKQVSVRNLLTSETFALSYDQLVLAPGSVPVVPPLPGIGDNRILTLRNLPDMDRIIQAAAGAQRILVVGAGFIGLEMAEQFIHTGKQVTLVELQDQVLPQLDPEMAKPVGRSLQSHGVDLILSDGITAFEGTTEGVIAKLRSGKSSCFDLVILSIGVRPETELAKQAGLALGARGHIVVDAFQRTSDPFIYAAGDAVETRCGITGDRTAIPLGGPANRQARVIADHIVHPESTLSYPGSIGTSIVRVFETVAGITGLSEKRLILMGRPYEKVIVSDFNHASYYPGATPLTVKIVYDPQTLQLLGGQVFGNEGVDKRLDVLATALRGKLTVEDLEHLELAYAPPFGSAKDPVNTAGFTARNKQLGLVNCIHELPSDPDTQLIDVRPPAMQQQAPLAIAKHIPITELRQRLQEIDPKRPVVTICKLGKLSYFAARILQQRGYDVKSFSGGVWVR